ncbi:MAG: hypothetical protein ACKVQW_09525 [Pyrinomonadaceae bacterium]
MSDKDCTNDCTTPLRFPRRPGTEILSAHGEDCFCCSDASRISQDNRPSLSRFNYRIGTYGSIREYLFHELNQTPELQNWTHRAPDDPAVALIEGAAILGDILTFYQEAYANEAYLRTAQWRESVSDLVRLLGYRLSPAVGGKATFAFELKKNEAVTIPVGFPVKATLEDIAKPAEFETIEEITAYPWLSRFNLYRPLIPDTGDEINEFYIPDPNQLLDPIELKVGDRLIVGITNGVGLDQPTALENAEIVIVDSIDELHGIKNYKVKGIVNLTSDENLVAFRLGRTFHHFGYNSATQIVDTTEPITSKATVIEPETTTESTIPMIDVARGRPVKTLSGSFQPSGVNTPLRDGEFPIDAEVNDLVAGAPVVIQAPYWEPPAFLLDAFVHKPKYEQGSDEVFKVPDDLALSQQRKGRDFTSSFDFSATTVSEPLRSLTVSGRSLSLKDELAVFLAEARPVLTSVRTISSIEPITLTWGSISGAVSKLKLDSTLETSVGGDSNWLQTDTALFHEVTSPLFVFRRRQLETTSTSGETLNFYGIEAHADDLMNRRVMLDGPTGEPKIVSVTNVVTSPAAGTESLAQLYPVTLSETVEYSDYPNVAPTVTVFGNLADADEGRTQLEVAIGSGDATQVFQNFKLPKAPLTYHIVAENTPSETPEIVIYVDGREWTQVDSFFDREPDEQVYIVREDADGASWAQFGDGKTGSRLTTGVNNVTAIYRLGGGAYGPLKLDTKVQASAKLKNLDKIGMPMDATGGAEPEDGENARNAAPGKVQSLGRIVSLKDFESEAAAISGVASASAAWDLVDNVPSVVVTVLMETGRGTEITEVRKTLNAYNNQRGAARNSVVVIHGKRRYVTARVEYELKPTYRADIIEPAIRLALGVNYGKATRDEDQTGLFSMRRRRFGVREYASTIEGWVQNVDGVLWARVVAFQEILPPTDTIALATFDEDDPATYPTPATSVLNPIVTCGGGHILSLYDNHLTLAPVKEVAS